MKAYNIDWDIDDDDFEDGEELDLPDEIEIPDYILDGLDEDEYEDAISDYISDLTGFCHCGFDLDTDEEDV